MRSSPERPTLLTVGIALTALTSVFKVFLVGILGMLFELGMVGGMADSHGDDWAGFFAGGFVAAVLGCFLFVLWAVELAICFKALSMKRFWLWALIIVSALGLGSFPIGTAVGVITIVGCAQAFERLASPTSLGSPAPPAPPTSAPPPGA